MSYVPERITDYPQDIDDCPLHIDAEKLREAVEKYYEDPIGVKVALAIATFADSKGLAFPSVKRLSDMTGFTWQEVSKAVGRLQALGILTIQRRRFKNSQHCHNEYRFVKKFVRKIADIRSSHFLGNVLKWKAKAQDVATAVVAHAVKTVGGKVKQVASAMSASAASGVKDASSASAASEHERNASNAAEPASAEPVQEKPVQPVPAPAEPVMSAPAPIQEQPVEDGEPFPEADTPVEWDYVSEKDMDKMFQVFDAHPELVDDPEKAAEMAGVVFSSASAAEPVRGETAPVQEPVEPVSPVKRETNLETLPANTESVSAVGSTVQANIPANIQAENAPKFINGEVDARWRSQMMLHQVNPTMYPAW